MLVDVLLLGGPEDGAVRQLEHDLDCYVIASAQHGASHTYYLEPFAGAERVWHIGVHHTIRTGPGVYGSLDAILARLIELYVEKSASKTDIPT